MEKCGYLFQTEKRGVDYFLDCAIIPIIVADYSAKYKYGVGESLKEN